MTPDPHPEKRTAEASSAERDADWPENPVLLRIRRGPWIESQHRGAWVLVDTAGEVLDGGGTCDEQIFARSSVKSLQALPLIESGAADRFELTETELAAALASHNAEACHVDTVRGVLERLELSADDLLCGAQQPGDPEARTALAVAGEKPTAIHNNCSGKHAGFLALARHLGEDPKSYLDPESQVQQLVRQAVLDLTGLAPDELTTAIDGCSAPTFRMPLKSLATAFARVANPGDFEEARRDACERMLVAVAANPIMIAGRHKRICTDLVHVSGGRLFPKVGAEGVYAIGVCGSDRALAIKIDDGDIRGLNALIIGLLRRFEFLSESELAKLERWEGKHLKNWAGLDVASTEVIA